MDKGAWWAAVHRLLESDTTERAIHTQSPTTISLLPTSLSPGVTTSSLHLSLFLLCYIHLFVLCFRFHT